MKAFFILLSVVSLLSCSTTDIDRNPYLQEPSFTFEINLNLPLYSNLNTPGNVIYVDNPGVGVRGVFIVNNGTDFYAWEASCPNHTPNTCSIMKIVEGINCKCDCENFKYNLFTGNPTGDNLPEGQTHGLLNYRAYSSGTSVVVTNN